MFLLLMHTELALLFWVVADSIVFSSYASPAVLKWKIPVTYCTGDGSSEELTHLGYICHFQRGRSWSRGGGAMASVVSHPPQQTWCFYQGSAGCVAECPREGSRASSQWEAPGAAQIGAVGKGRVGVVSQKNNCGFSVAEVAARSPGCKPSPRR